MKRSPIQFFGTKISDNIIKSPDGSIVCKNAVIARTGFQTYTGKELPADELEAQGVTLYDDDKVNVYRSPDEVFSAKTIASFQGKPLTCGHPPDLLTTDTIGEYQCGTLMHVRKGDEPLPTGDWPLLGDLVVTDPDAIEGIMSGRLRELSCGYNFHLSCKENQILQVDMIGNHVALVEAGRAGPHAKIVDSMPTEDITAAKIETEKSKMPVTLKNLIALGLKAFAVDAKPEELASAMDAISESNKPVATDSAHGKDCDCKDCKAGMDAAMDAKAKDRKRLHDALDRVLDDKDKEAAMEDADMEELSGLLAGGAGALKSKEVAADEEPEADDEDMGEEADDEEDDDDAEAEDEAVESNPSPVIPEGDRQEKVVPSATDSVAKEILKTLKPIVAASKDKRLKAAFDSANKLVYKKAVKGKTNTKDFAAAARDRKGVANDGIDPEKKRIEDANDAYSKMRRKSYKAE